MMNPYLIVAALSVWIASVGGSAWWFYGAGKESEQATQAKVEDARRETRELAQQAAAEAIAGIKVQHRTVTQKVERVITEVPVYRDCKHSDGVVRDINDAIAGKRPEPARSGSVPDTHPAP